MFSEVMFKITFKVFIVYVFGGGEGQRERGRQNLKWALLVSAKPDVGLKPMTLNQLSHQSLPKIIF